MKKKLYIAIGLLLAAIAVPKAVLLAPSPDARIQATPYLAENVGSENEQPPLPPQSEPPPSTRPPSSECIFQTVNIKAVGRGGSRLTLKGPGATLSCLSKIVDTCKVSVKKRKHRDDCVADTLCSRGGAFVGVTSCNNRSFTMYMDDQCQGLPVPAPGTPNGPQCYVNIRYIASPISLVLDEVAEAPTLVNFPLEGEESTAAQYSWKASANRPLLVFDPEQTGEITSASQLFGNHTFGKAWKHGYEPLQTLDKDGDGKISGAERAGLALWFDANRDGISQPGEVRTLEAENITAVFVTPNSRDPLTNELGASPGFERLVDGSVVSGRSVDWLGSAQVHTETTPQSPVVESAQLRGSDGELAGMWIWSVDGDYGPHAPKGVLTLNEDENGVSGTSFIELPLLGGGKDAPQTVLNSLPFRGAKVTDSDNNVRLSFTLRDQNNTDTITEAFLSADGQTLKGKSTLVYASGGSDSKEEFTYTWTAQRP